MQSSSEPQINVGHQERTISLAGGTALMAYAISRRNTSSIPLLILGLLLLSRGATGRSWFYQMINRNMAIKTNPRRVSVPHEQGIHVTRAVTINRPIEDLYAFWRDPTNLPQVIDYIESVQMTGNNQAHWTIKLPGDLHVDFEVEVYTDVPNEVISWRSLPGSRIQSAGSIRFRPAPAGRGTQVHLTLEFVPPGGPIGQAVLNMFGEIPAQYVNQYLREFKQVMETGEKATTEGQTSGRKQEVRQ